MNFYVFFLFVEFWVEGDGWWYRIYKSLYVFIPDTPSFCDPRYGLFIEDVFLFFVCGGGEEFKKVFGQHVFFGIFNRYFQPRTPKKQEMNTGGEKTSGYPPSNRPNPWILSS